MEDSYFGDLNIKKLREYAKKWAGKDQYPALRKLTLYKPNDDRCDTDNKDKQYVFVAVHSTEDRSEESRYLDWCWETCIHIQKDLPRFYKEEKDRGSDCYPNWRWLPISEAKPWDLSDFVDSEVYIALFPYSEVEEKAKKERIERERVEGIRAKIAKISIAIIDAQGKTAADIRSMIDELFAKVVIEAEFQEFTQKALKVRAESITALKQAYDNRLEWEAEQDKAEAERKRLEVIHKEAEEKAREPLAGGDLYPNAVLMLLQNAKPQVDKLWEGMLSIQKTMLPDNHSDIRDSYKDAALTYLEQPGMNYELITKEILDDNYLYYFGAPDKPLDKGHYKRNFIGKLYQLLINKSFPKELPEPSKAPRRYGVKKLVGLHKEQP